VPQVQDPNDPVVNPKRERGRSRSRYRNRNQLEALLVTLETEAEAFNATADAYMQSVNWLEKKSLAVDRDIIASVAFGVALALSAAIDRIEKALAETDKLDWE
jgi:hypothetical protein